jgi:deazaflavin-dependent oxidoreductase (nitroreductase family)
MGKMIMRFFTMLHGQILKRTGAFGGGTEDGSTLVLRHVGAKSSKVRETPIMFLTHDGGYAVVASMGGSPKHPGWYHNLKANPTTVVTIARKTIAVRARELIGEERAAVWARLTASDERWEQYQLRTERVLPILALDPM